MTSWLAESLPLLVDPPQMTLISCLASHLVFKGLFLQEACHVFSVNLSHRRDPWHTGFAFSTFCCLVDAKQLGECSEYEAKGTIKVSEKKYKMLEIRLALILVEFQGCFVHNPAGY